MAPREILIVPGVTIREEEIIWRFSGSGGPGGQHANTANTRVEAVLSIEESPSLPEAAKRRLVARLGPVVRVVVSDERSQLRNRELAVERLAERLRTSLTPRKRRVSTRPTKASVERRLEGKRRTARKKHERGTGEVE